MSQFPQNPRNELRRRAIPRAPRLGIQGRINTPGLVVRPATPETAAQAQQIRQFLGTAGGLAGQVSGLAAGVAREEEKEIEEHKIFDRSRASEDYRTQLAVDRSNVAELFNTVPEGQKVEDYVDDLIDARTEGQTETYRNSYRSGLKPALVASLLEHQDGVKKQARGELAEIVSENVIDAGSADEITAIYDEVRQLPLFDDITDTDLKGKLFLPALESSANAGDAVRFEAIVEAIGDRFPEAILDGQRVFAAAQNRIEREKADPGRESVFNALNEGNFDSAEEIIQRERKNGNFTQELANQMSNQVGVQRRTKNSAIIRGMIEQDETRQRNGIVDANFVASGDNPASLIHAQDSEYTKLDGSKGVIKKADIVAGVIDRKFAAIDLDFPPDEDPGSNITAKTRFLAKSGGQVYAPWKRLLSGVSAMITTDMEEISPTLVAAYELYQRLDLENPHVASVHATGVSRDFYRSVQLFQNELGLDVSAAMIEASRNRNIPANIDPSELDRAASNAFPKAKNSRQIVGVIGERARAYIKTTGMGVDVALDRAVKDFKSDFTIINGFAVRTAGRTLPQNMVSVSEHIIDWYASENGIDSDTLTIRSMDDSTWRITDQDGAAIGIFDLTDTEMNMIGAKLFDDEASKVRTELIAKRAARDAATSRPLLNAVGGKKPRARKPIGDELDEKPIEGARLANPDAFAGQTKRETTEVEKPDKSLVDKIAGFKTTPKPKSQKTGTGKRVEGLVINK